ncbi:MAG TPA: DUF2298 domain-containing protein [Herpetosiphonaceae bacterium]
MFWPVLRWWLGIELLGLLALPLTMWIFRFLPGRGMAWSKAAGLLLAGYGAWLLTTLGFGSFGTGPVVLAAAGLAGLSWWAARRVTWAALRDEIRQRWRAWLGYEALFLALLLLGIWLRLNGMYGSAIRSTEKPMELMMLSAVLNSPSFPPNDLWLAGYSVNYYYLGYVLIATLKVLSGVALGEAFNLGVATVFALAGLGIAGLLATLTELAGRGGERAPGLAGRLAAIGLGLALVLGAGNQYGALQRIVGSSQINRLENGQLVGVVLQALQGVEPRTVDPASVRPADSTEASSALQPMGGAFDWWAPSRGVYDVVNKVPVVVDGVQRDGEVQAEVITEFPFFSFYLGDMHPHVLVLPWSLLVLALSLALLARPAAPSWRGRDGLELGLGALTIGSLYMLNSWDLPTYGLIYGLALAGAWRRHSPDWRAALRGGGPQLAGVLGGALALFAPFMLTFTSFAGQDQVPPPWDKVPILSKLGKTIGPVLDRTSWSELLAIFGLFLPPLLAWWAGVARARSGWLWVAAFAVAGLVLNAPTLAFFPLAALLLREALRRPDEPATALACLAGGVAVLLLAGVDWVYLRDNFDRRMNTVFKVYYQVWLLLGVTAAYACWALLRREAAGRSRLRTLAWAPLFALLLAGAAVYPYSVLSPSTSPRWNDAPKLLDGLEYFRTAQPGLLEAAEWARANTQPGDRFASSKGSSYQHGGMLAAIAGRSSLLVWPGSHEGLWRSKQPQARDQVGARGNALAGIYTAADPAQDPAALEQAKALLAANKVDYIVVGPDERIDVPGTEFPAMAQLGTLVYDAAGWRIYKVQR